MQAPSQSTTAARIPTITSLAPVTPPVAEPSIAETSGLAHDAGNLLAALSLYSELLSVPGVLRPEHQHYATELRLISDRSAQLIRRLLAAPPASLQRARSLSSDAPPLLPPALVRRRNARSSDFPATRPNHAAMLLSLAPVLQRIAAGAAEVTVTCPIALPALNFPSEIIERITVNLVRNAAEVLRLQQASNSRASSSALGEIRVSLNVVAEHVQLTVEDNGPGMSPSNVEAYLNPQPLPSGANHGLGHRIIHELAAASGAQLSIRVRPGHGTAFCLKWPVPETLPAGPCPSDVTSSPSTP